VPLTVAVKMLPTPTAKANMMAPSMQKWAAHRNLLPGLHSTNGTPGQETSEEPEKSTTGSMAMFPTPTAHLGHRRSCPSPEHAARRYAQGRRNLEDAVALSFRTPMSADARGSSGRAKDGKQMQLADQVGGSLNPTWVEWLMGFPLGWTSSALWETRLSRTSRKSSAAP
jgi:hypothetical protein